ncbi:MAG: family 43 glycosylhydrolase, partial [Oscillospiraceae bacterium]|nr:family 43 glycosylhydrolase [Oscillospiraceae bacterium]
MNYISYRSYPPYPEAEDYSYPFGTNPLMNRSGTAPLGANDPWVIYDDRPGFECYYYVWSNSGVRVAKMDDFYNLADNYNVSGQYRQAWSDSGLYYGGVWAPEMFLFENDPNDIEDDRWVTYAAALTQNNNNESRRMIACVSSTNDPMGQWEAPVTMNITPDRWAIDGTVMRYNGKNYFIWSGWDGTVDVEQITYIAEMSSPTELATERVMISRPDQSWEQLGGRPWINEGQVWVERNGKHYILYSGSGSWSDDYCVGVLALTGDNPLDPAHWTKHPTPILEKSVDMQESGVGMYGPGHPSVTTSRDGRDWLVYHANVNGGSGWSGRSAWIQLMLWDDNDFPVIFQGNMVDYNLNGGTGSVPLRTATLGTKGNVIHSVQNIPGDAQPPEGRRFTEWNTAPDGSGTKYSTGEKITLQSHETNPLLGYKLTLYAQYEKVPHELEYIYNYPGDFRTSLTSPGYVEGHSFSTIRLVFLGWSSPPPGKQFKHWNTSENGTGDAYDQGQQITMPNHAMKLYAIWVDESVGIFTVTYNANGGTGTSPIETRKETGEKFIAKASPYTPPSEDLPFLRWNTQADGNGISYAPGDEV